MISVRSTSVLTVVMSLALFTAGPVSAQQPRRDRDPGKEPTPRTDKALEDWVRLLSEKITDRHDVIRDTAREAIVGVGRPALPVLKKLADGEDAATAEAARRLIGRIEHGGQPGRPFPGGPGGFPGGPGVRRPAGPEHRQPPLEEVIRHLNLDERQMRKVGEIMQAHGKRMDEFAQQVREGKVEREHMPIAQQKLHEVLLGELKGILTEEQFKKLENAIRHSPPEAPRGRRGDAGGRPAPEARTPNITIGIVETDPIEIGNSTVYEIQVRIVGTVPATNVRITAVVPDEMKVTDLKGATEGKADGQKITFEPLRVLEPSKVFLYKVHVQAIRVGDVRFKVELTADQLRSGPLHLEQSTTIYMRPRATSPQREQIYRKP